MTDNKLSDDKHKRKVAKKLLRKLLEKNKSKMKQILMEEKKPVHYNRLYSINEKNAITLDAQGYLTHLFMNNSISDFLMEKVIFICLNIKMTTGHTVTKDMLNTLLDLSLLEDMAEVNIKEILGIITSSTNSKNDEIYN